MENGSNQINQIMQGHHDTIDPDTVKYQVDNGSATTTSRDETAVHGYWSYPDKKRPNLTGATSHKIQSTGHGILPTITNRETDEQIHSKVTPGIKHNIISPGQHVKLNKNIY